MNFLPDAGRRPAALSVLALAVAGWMSVPLLLLIPGTEIDLGLTVDNAVFVVENAAMTGTVVLVVGAVTLRARRVLTVAMVVAGLHLLLQLGTAVVQLVKGARPDLLLGTLVTVLVLTVVLGGAGLLRLPHAPVAARRTGVVIVLAGAFVHTLWTNVLLPLVAILPYGGPPPGMVRSLLLSMALNLLIVVGAALCGWASSRMRRIGALLAAVVGVLGMVAAAGSSRVLGGPYAAVQVVQALVTLSAVPFAVVAGRRLAASRAAVTEGARPRATVQPPAKA